MRQRKCDKQTWGGITTTVISFVETSHCVLLEGKENQYKNACKIVCTQQVVFTYCKRHHVWCMISLLQAFTQEIQMFAASLMYVGNSAL